MKTLGIIAVVTGGLMAASAMAGTGNTGLGDMSNVASAEPVHTIQLAQTSATPLQPGFRTNQPKPPTPGGFAPTPKPFKPGLKPNPTPFKPGFKAPTSGGPGHTGVGGFQGTANISCAFGFTKTKAQKGAKGYVVKLECLSAVIKCPSLSENVGAQGSPNGMGTTVEKVNVPVGNEQNHFRVKYSCTYYHTEG